MFICYCWKSKFVTKVQIWRYKCFRYMLFHGPRFYFRCTVGARHERAPNFSCPVYRWIWLCFGYHKEYFFSLNKYLCITFHTFHPVSLWLKDHNESKLIIRLFCVILAELFFSSLILLLTSTFFLIFIYIIYLLIFCTYLDHLLFMAK